MLNNSGFMFLSGASAVSVSEVMFTLLFAVFTLISCVALVFLLTRFMGKRTKEAAISAQAVTSKPSAEVTAVGGGTQSVSEDVKPQQAVGKSEVAKQQKFNFAALLAVIITIGVILRLIFTFLIRGYRPEYNGITALIEYVQGSGFVNAFYTGVGKDMSIYPLAYYIFALFGSFGTIFGLGADDALMALFVKLPFIICDAFTAVLLYKVAKKYINQYVAIIIAAFVCICPIFVFASAVWGSIYSIIMLGLVATLYFVAQKNYPAVIGVFGATMLTSFSVIYVLPLIGVFVVYGFIKALRTTLKNKPDSIGTILKNKDTAPVITIPLGLIVTALLMYLITLPLLVDSFGGSFFAYIFHFFLKPFDSLSIFGRNSLGIFNLFLRNGKDLGVEFPSIVFTVIFGAIILGITLLIYLSKKNRANMVYLGGYIVLTLATYFVDFTELSLLPVLGIFLLAFLLIKDKRILQIFTVLSVVMVINASLVMVSADYLNNFAYYLVGGGSPSYVGKLILEGGSGIATSIICSVLVILAHLYSTLVLLDISMSNKRKLLYENQSSGFKTAIAEFFKIK